MINTVYELITDVMAKQYPDRVAFRYVAADGKTVVEKTYAQYVQDIRRAVTYFKENIPDIKGKRVGIMSRNCYEYGVNSFGAILAGAVVVTINQKKTWPELEYELGLVDDANDAIKKMEKNGDISEDELKDNEDKIQKLTDKYVGQIDKAVESKSKEIMTV